MSRWVFGYLETKKLFCLSSSLQVLHLDMTTPHDSYDWNSIELATLLTLTESLAEGRLEPLTVVHKNLTTLSYHDTSNL